MAWLRPSRTLKCLGDGEPFILKCRLAEALREFDAKTQEMRIGRNGRLAKRVYCRLDQRQRALRIVLGSIEPVASSLRGLAQRFRIVRQLGEAIGFEQAVMSAGNAALWS